MAANDVKILGRLPNTRQYRVNDTTTSSDTQLLVGEPVKVAGNFATHVATAEPVITAPMLGIVAKASTETSTADGVVDVYVVEPGVTLLETKAHTPANIDSDAKLLGVLNDSVTYDLTTGTYTINEDEGTDPNVHGLQIVDGDIVEGTLSYVVKGYACEYTSSI